MAELPEIYCERMKSLLGEEYGEYLESFSMAPHTAYRINTSKVSTEKWGSKPLFSTGVVNWCEKGYYYDGEQHSPGKHPYYFAGLYYIQEPSAMIPASILPVKPGDMVLDLCAAPGGKATELGSKLAGTGFLVANDVSASRTMALTKNLQMAGIANVLVTAETPERLSRVFPAYFDKILIDAPCSGEGMFRREPRMIKDWLEKGPDDYAPLQKEILEQAYQMLKPGGKMVYSTCTFSVEEDEEVVNWLLSEHGDMKICPVQRWEGFSSGRTEWLRKPVASMEDCVRIFPHKAQGEGHFAVLLEKTEKERGNSLLDREDSHKAGVQENSLMDKTYPGAQACCQKVVAAKMLCCDKTLKKKMGEAWEDVREFLQHVFLPPGIFTYKKDTLFWHSHREPAHQGLRVMYGGVPVCKWKHKVQPSPQLALLLQEADYDNVLSLEAEDERVIRYLKGETLQIQEALKGNVLFCVEGYGLGWCQGNGRGMLKNKYHPGWRYQ